MGNLILATKRLVLEELGDERFEELAALLSNEKVHRYFPKTLNVNESLEFLRAVQKRQHDDGISFWAVLQKEGAVFLGICGLLKQMVDDVEEVEVGYRINDCYWGNGFGTEAAAGCIQFARQVLGVASVISLILPVNGPSIRVAEKNGLQLEKEALFSGQIHLVYRIRFKP